MLQRTSTLSSPATDRHARDDNFASCTPAPTIDSGIVSHTLDHVNCDSSLPSTERHEGTTAAERCSSRVIENPAPAIAVELAGLQLRDSTATPVSREDSLSPGLFDKLQLRDSTPLTLSRGASLSPSPGTRRRSSLGRPKRPRHEVGDEVQTETFYNAHFQSAFKSSKAIASHLETALASGGLHTDDSSTTYALYRQARELSNHRGPRHWKIGLVGDSGNGKDSFPSWCLISMD